MENNSRGNTKVQNTMHELSYGSQSSKGRRSLLTFIAIVSVAVLLPVKYIHITGIIATLFLMYNYAKNEPKQNIEPKLILEPEYRLTQIDAIAMLRNAQVEKRGR